MPTIADLITRCASYLQDPLHDVWSPSVITTQLHEEIQRLARQQLFGLVQWRQGQAGVSHYVFADDTVLVTHVVYDSHTLRPALEEHLTRYQRTWEQNASRPPQFVTLDLQAPQTVRLVPTPSLTGSAVPQIPSEPLMQRESLNLIAYTFVQPQHSGVVFELNDALEDIVVFQTVGTLAGNAGEFQDSSKQTCFAQLAKMMLDALVGDSA